jgi:hypothetical protein
MPTYTYMQAERPKAAVADVAPQPRKAPLTGPERTGRYIERALAAMTGLAGLFFVYELYIYFSYAH